MTVAELRASLSGFRRPEFGASLWQLGHTLALYLLAWGALAWSFTSAPWVSPLLALPAAGLLVRLFIIQHDCGHRSFFVSKAANDVVGFVLGVLTLAPYHYWRKTHALHHGNVGDLDRRHELGYIPVLTVAEYQAMTPSRRLRYRVLRHPLFLVGFGLPFQFIVWHRLPLNTPAAWRAEWGSVLFTDLALVGLAAGGAATVGLGTFLLTSLLVSGLAAAAGGWLFYLQHNFPGAYLSRGAGWDPGRAALEGSSRLELPALLAWLSGDIGLHHVHHLDSQIPNYRLRDALSSSPALRAVPAMRLVDTPRAWRLKLYDEGAGRLVSFDEIR